MLRVAEEESVDLIVVGSRGIGGGPAQLLGSTSRHLVENAVMPVTVLPAAG
jgi:nucleotide-binding universal stress UspA family protein